MRRRLGLLAVFGFFAAAGCSGSAPPTVRPAAPPAPPPVVVARPFVAPSDAVAAAHLLDRFSFGPRPGDLERVKALGVLGWLDAELKPPKEPDTRGEAALEPYRAALSPPVELLDKFARSDTEMDPLDARRLAAPPALAQGRKVPLNKQLKMDELDALRKVPLKKQLKKQIDTQRLLQNVIMAEVARHVASDRQVEEVMVDFFTNHFNVFAMKGPSELFVGDYVERAIRPYVLGRFEDLLIATARHPAMLIYLDNAQSVAPQPGTGKRRGLNENYARELLELHTLGVDGGYTQNDVTEVARILTGYGVQRPEQGPIGFVFRPRQHDQGEKVVLGTHFATGGGEEEAIRLLQMLARHPSTARHLATKLCARFVSDTPPEGCIDEVMRAYLDSGGNVQTMLRAIVNTPEFWENRGNKLKSPLEFVVSAVRAVDGGTNGDLGLTGVLRRLGEPPLLDPIPTGYPEGADDWSSSSAMLGRMNFALQLATGRAPGVNLDLDRLLPPTLGIDDLVARVDALIFSGQGSPRTLELLKQEAADGEPNLARQRVLALALSSPDFQRQ